MHPGWLLYTRRDRLFRRCLDGRLLGQLRSFSTARPSGEDAPRADVQLQRVILSRADDADSLHVSARH